MRNVNTPTNHHQQEIQEFRFQHLADDPSGWADGVGWYRTTINRIKMMAAGVARIIPFLATSGTPTANGIGQAGSLGSSSDAALADHAHATPGLATSGSSGFMSGTHVDHLDTAYSHAGTSGNPHGTTIGQISGLQMALDGKSNVGHGHTIGDVSGLATALGLKADLVDGKVPASQLPSYVDDVVEYVNRAAFPATGEAGKIYIALDTDHQWRWTGTTYADMTSEGGDLFNIGTTLDGLGDPFSARESYDGRGGLKTGNGSGPFGSKYYNIVDVRHRNGAGDGVDAYGGMIAWEMLETVPRIAYRTRVATTWTDWIELSKVGHVHAQYTQKAAFLIGDTSSTVFTLTHSLGTKDVRVTVRRNSAPWDMVEVSDELDATDPDNKVKLTFYGEVPETNEYRVVVMG